MALGDDELAVDARGCDNLWFDDGSESAPDRCPGCTAVPSAPGRSMPDVCHGTIVSATPLSTWPLWSIIILIGLIVGSLMALSVGADGSATLLALSALGLVYLYAR